MLLSKKDVNRITDEILSYVKADDAQVSVSSNKRSHLRFARNEFLTSGNTVGQSANITVWIDGRRGSSSTTNLDAVSIGAMVKQAEEIAKISPIDKQYLPSLSLQKYRETNGYVESTANISLKARAKKISDILKQSDAANVISAGFHQTRATAGGFATKNGNFGYQRSTDASLSMTARTPDGTSSGYFQRSHHDIDQLDTLRIAHESIKKATDGRNPKAIEPGSHTVILEPQAVADLLRGLAFQFDARRAEEGRSPFSLLGGKTKLGQQIFDTRINILSDPWHRDVPSSSSVRSGIPAQKLYLVKNGILENLVYSRFWAKRKNTEPTPGPVNSIIESSEKANSFDQMIGSTEKGLLISRFWYIRTTDPRTASVTGLTRDGIWFVEDGKIKHAAKNFRFNQSIIQMLASGNVEMIGDTERIGRSLFPALKLTSFNFTSSSEAV